MARTNETVVCLLPKHAGCWFDCARGIYIGEAVIKEALAYGWKPAEPLGADATVDGEFYHEATDEATEFLDSLAPEGYWIGFSDWGGDFGMWESEPEESEPEESEEETPAVPACCIIGCGEPGTVEYHQWHMCEEHMATTTGQEG